MPPKSLNIDTTYIKLDWNSDNFLIFWCTLVYMRATDRTEEEEGITQSLQCLPSLSPMAMSPHGEPPRWTWEEKTYHALSLMIKYDTIVG